MSVVIESWIATHMDGVTCGDTTEDTQDDEDDLCAYAYDGEDDDGEDDGRSRQPWSIVACDDDGRPLIDTVVSREGTPPRNIPPHNP